MTIIPAFPPSLFSNRLRHNDHKYIEKENYNKKEKFEKTKLRVLKKDNDTCISYASSNQQ